MIRILATFFVLLLFSLSYALDHTAFFRVLVDVPGWEASRPEGMTVNSGGQRQLTAHREYTKGSSSLSVTVMCGPGAQGAAFFFSGMNDMFLSGQGGSLRVKSLTLQGRPAKVVMTDGGLTFYVLLSKVASNPSTTAIMVFDFRGVDYNRAVSVIRRFPIQEAVRLARGI